MDEFKHYAVFAATVTSGSMSAAARQLRMTPSAVSQAIRALEQHAGVTLLHRSTRKLTLTEAGARCYPHCRALFDAAQAATAALESARDAPSGQLRIAAPVGFATHITPALAGLLAEAPGLSLQLLVDDAMIDLIDERIDIALRVGKLADSSAIARPLCELDVIICATAEYLARHGVPQAPADLAGHQWLASARETAHAGAQHADGELPSLVFDLTINGQAEQVRAPVRFASNNQLTLQQMCEQGLGLARLGHADVMASLQRGTLVRVLPQWRCRSMPVSAITQRREGEPAKVRAALLALASYFATLPGTSSAPAPWEI